MHPDATDIGRWIRNKTVGASAHDAMVDHSALGIGTTGRVAQAEISTLFVDASRHRRALRIGATTSPTQSTFADFSEAVGIVTTLRVTVAQRTLLGEGTVVVRSAR